MFLKPKWQTIPEKSFSVFYHKFVKYFFAPCPTFPTQNETLALLLLIYVVNIVKLQDIKEKSDIEAHMTISQDGTETFEHQNLSALFYHI